MKDRAAILVLALIYAAASLLHHVHNAEYLRDYPNMPRGISAAGVYAVWLAETAVGIAGYVLLRRGWRVAGTAALALYAAAGFYGLAHYSLAPLSAHSATMNLTIWLEVATAAMLLIGLAVVTRRTDAIVAAK